ncbi:MAG: 5-formyltetrahydrofolate cyclo-ligase [Chloroherpetonaceae bacterium]|nr:5-formyltetrahydrofolate cyclo-ligase [Chloroherpetonaceae bacterium]
MKIGEIKAARDALRSQMKAQRMALQAKQYDALCQALSLRLLELPEVTAARSVHLFLSIKEKREPDLTPLINALHQRGAAIAVPLVQGREIQSVALLPQSELHQAGFQVPVPKEVIAFDEKRLDVILVPLLAFDKKGNRLGYGKGFYDRFLERLQSEGVSAKALGVAFSFQEVPAIPLFDELEHRDFPLEMVITENGRVR